MAVKKLGLLDFFVGSGRLWVVCTPILGILCVQGIVWVSYCNPVITDIVIPIGMCTDSKYYNCIMFYEIVIL